MASLLLLLSAIETTLYLGYFPVLVKFRPQPFLDVPVVKFEGAMAPNNKIDAAEKLFLNKIDAPESLAVYEGAMYTGTGYPGIVRIKDNELKVVAKTGNKCLVYKEGNQCSRPYGIRFDKKGTLYVADGYRGLLKVDVKTGAVEVLIKFGEELDGAPVSFLDDLDVDDDDGSIYVSDLSTRWKVYQFPYGFIENENSGRLLKYDIKTKQTSVIAKDLYWPNGVQLHPDKDSVLVAETTGMRITRVYTKGSKKGTSETFTLLPGMPDNIRPSKRGGYWVALAMGRNPTQISLQRTLLGPAAIRTILLRLSYYIGSALEYFNNLIPHSPLIKQFAYYIKMTDYFFEVSGGPGVIIELDKDGNIINSLQASDKTFSSLSEVLETDDGYLFIASFAMQFLTRLKV